MPHQSIAGPRTISGAMSLPIWPKAAPHKSTDVYLQAGARAGHTLDRATHFDAKSAGRHGAAARFYFATMAGDRYGDAF